jgi:nitrite reductase (NO-forming)
VVGGTDRYTDPLHAHPPVGRSAELPVAPVAVAGTVYLAGVVLLGVLLVTTVRRGVERRFDVAVAAYVAALVAGIAGAVVGVVMAVGSPSPALRSAHVTLNLLGLVGLVVAGTLPFFAATVVRARMSPRASARRLVLMLGGQVCMLVLAVSALAVGAASVAAIGLAGYAVGIIAVFDCLPRPTRRQLRWAGPRLVGLWCGGAWWVVAVAATALDAAAGRAVFDGRWLAVLVIAGYAQLMWGSLAYLLPMLRGGGHERLAEGFATTRSWLGLVAANLAGLAMAGSWMPAAAACVTVWMLDSAWRAARVGTSQAVRPTKE